jgi:hypothetical protein
MSWQLRVFCPCFLLLVEIRVTSLYVGGEHDEEVNVVGYDLPWVVA